MKNKIVTYADGFGNWNARVEFPVATPLQDIRDDSVRRVARRAIKRELEERAPRHGLQGYRVKIVLDKTVYGSENKVCSITFTERG